MSSEINEKNAKTNASKVIGRPFITASLIQSVTADMMVDALRVNLFTSVKEFLDLLYFFHPVVSATLMPFYAFCRAGQIRCLRVFFGPAKDRLADIIAPRGRRVFGMLAGPG